jgi:hypothetical protein
MLGVQLRHACVRRARITRGAAKAPEIQGQPMIQPTRSPPAALSRTFIVLAAFVLGLHGCATPPPEPPPASPPPPPPPVETPSEAPGGQEPSPAGGEAATPESSGAEAGTPEASPAEASAPETSAGAGSGAVSTGGSRAEELEGQFEASLGTFDGVLLSEQERLAEQRQKAAESEARGTVPGGGTAGAYEDAGGAGEGSFGGTGAPPPGEGGSAGETDAGTEGAGGAMGTGSGGGAGVPADVGSGADDDIVARQLREAAMKEKDPELREKLWDEYRNYKQGIGR